MNAPLQKIELSVVLTTVDHRGHIMECVASWTRAQTLARERYEVLVVTSGREPDVDAAARALLTAGDRLLVLEEGNEQVLFNHGARRARGKWLLFTEAHCAAMPSCLAELLAYLEAHEAEYAGACLRTLTDGNCHPLAQLESRAYQEGFATWSRAGDWRKVTIRGFAVRRDVYLDLGGFESEAGCFAETVIAAALDANGHRLGYAEAAAVKHYNSPQLHDLLAYVREYREGEVAYQRRHPRGRFAAYFDWPESATAASAADRRALLACAAHSLARAAAHPFHAGSAAMARAMLAALAQAACDAVAGGKVRLIKAAAAYIWARACFAMPGAEADKLYRRYRVLWQATGELSRQRALARHGFSRSPAPIPAAPPLEYRPGTMQPAALIGFHARETWNGQPFRWSAPLALVRVSVPPGDYELRLDTHDLRPPPHSVDVYVNGRRTTPASVPVNGGLTFRMDRTMFQSSGDQAIVIATGRLRVANSAERRALGLPLFSITFVSVVSAPAEL